MEILPEEVALKYGYAADQRVVNIVLRRRFNSTSAELRGKGATDGGYVVGQGDATRLIIADGTRTSLNAHAEGNSPLYECERDILLQPVAQPARARSTRGRSEPWSRRTPTSACRAPTTGPSSAMFRRPSTLEAERDTSKSRFGVPTGELDVDGDRDDRARLPRRCAADPRLQPTDSLSLGTALNGQRASGGCPRPAMPSFNHSITRTDRGPDLSDIQARLDAGDPTLDPLGDLGAARRCCRAIAAARTATRLALDGTATGPLFALPAGDATATFRIGAGSTGIDSEATAPTA